MLLDFDDLLEMTKLPNVHIVYAEEEKINIIPADIREMLNVQYVPGLHESFNDPKTKDEFMNKLESIVQESDKSLITKLKKLIK